MANLELLITLLRRRPRHTRVLVGDSDQLAPVRAGKPFAELVEARPVPIAELTRIFRQAAGSLIARGAHAVRTGPR
jgi:exodeoxyribonuclease V alpha subunit